MHGVREILLVMIKSMTYVREIVGHDWSATTTVQWKDPTTLVSRPIKFVRLISFFLSLLLVNIVYWSILLRKSWLLGLEHVNCAGWMGREGVGRQGGLGGGAWGGGAEGSIRLI